MKTHEFTLYFELPPDRPDPKTWLDKLHAAGCGDATVGVGQPGRIGLVFSREGDTMESAIASAIADVERAIPNASRVFPLL